MLCSIITALKVFSNFPPITSFTQTTVKLAEVYLYGISDISDFGIQIISLGSSFNSFNINNCGDDL
jgi:hypothetical protein